MKELENQSTKESSINKFDELEEIDALGGDFKDVKFDKSNQEVSETVQFAFDVFEIRIYWESTSILFEINPEENPA